MIETLRTVPVDIKHCDFRVRIIVSHCTGVGFFGRKPKNYPKDALSDIKKYSYSE